MAGETKSSRRGFIKKSGLAGAFPLFSVTRKTDRMVKLPELRNQDGVVKWMEVPEQWKNHRDAAEKAREALGQRYGFDDRDSIAAPHEDQDKDTPDFVDNGVVELALERSPETYAGKHGFQLSVAVNPDNLSVEIPDAVNGVPVVTEERKEPPVDLCHNSSYSDVSGGVKVSPDTNLGSYGTTGVKVYYSHSDEYYMSTASHVVDSGDVYGDAGTYSFEKIGSVDYAYGQEEQDVCFFKCSRNIRNRIEGEDTTYSVGGWVTEDGISERVSSWTDGYRKSGCTTGETTGGLGKYKIGDSYHSGTPSYAGEGVRGSALAGEGDSGTVGFSVHNGDAYVTNFITQGDPKSSTSTSSCNSATTYSRSLGTAYYLFSTTYEIQGNSRK